MNWHSHPSEARLLFIRSLDYCERDAMRRALFMPPGRVSDLLIFAAACDAMKKTHRVPRLFADPPNGKSLVSSIHFLPETSSLVMMFSFSDAPLSHTFFFQLMTNIMEADQNEAGKKTFRTTNNTMVRGTKTNRFDGDQQEVMPYLYGASTTIFFDRNGVNSS